MKCSLVPNNFKERLTLPALHALACLAPLLTAALALTAPVFTSTPAQADEMLRPLTREEYGTPSVWTHGLREVRYLPVHGSRVAWANYSGLKRDFPQLAHMSDGEIDAWIIRNYAVVSVPQLELENVRYRNIAPASERASLLDGRTFLVPPGYGRAAIGVEQTALVTAKPALIDLKGTGHTHSNIVEQQRQNFAQASTLKEPARSLALDAIRTHDHSDGLMTLGEAVAEVSRQLAVQASFDLVNAKEGNAYQTVESYFVISLPMQILKTGENADPAAIYGRQAHFGRATKALRLPVEPTYSDDFGGKQNSRLGSAIDFGGVVITQPELQETFGDPALLKLAKSSRADAQLSNAWKYGHEAASAFLQQADHDYANARAILNTHFATMLSPLKVQLATAEKLAPKSRDVRLAEYLGQRDFESAFVMDQTIYNRGQKEISRMMLTWARAETTNSNPEALHERTQVLNALLRSFRPETVRGFIAAAFKNANFEINRNAQAQLLIATAQQYQKLGRATQIDALLTLFPSNTSRSPYPIVKIMASDSSLPQLRSLALFFKMSETEQAEIAKQIIASQNVTALNILKLELRKRRNLGKPLLEAILSTTAEAANDLRLIARTLTEKREPKLCLNVFGVFK